MAALYEVRHAYIFGNGSLDSYAIYARLKGHEAYQAWPAQGAQQVLRLLDKNWQSSCAACEASREDPSTFRMPPKMPHDKPKQDGRTLLVYTIQALSHAGLKAGLNQPSKLPITRETKQTRIAQVRIVPRLGF